MKTFKERCVYTEEQIREGFAKWHSYIDNGGEVVDTNGMTYEENVNCSAAALIAFIKGEYDVAE